jgi:hypothetical protein
VILRERIGGKALEEIEILLPVSLCITASLCVDVETGWKSGMLWLLSVKAAMQLQV